MPASGWTAWRQRIPKPLRHGITIFLIVLVVEYLVVPELVGASKHLALLSRLNVYWLAAGVLLEAASLFSYTLLTRALLPPSAPGLWTLARIDMAGNGIAHVVPGGSAASAGLGYRLTTSAGVDGKDAAFAMATQGMGSAVVLNVLLWCSLVISIPLAGFHPIYVVVALVGMLALLLIAALCFALTRGEDNAVRFVRAAGAKIPFLGEDRLETVFRNMSASLRDLARKPELLRRATLWASLNWLLDAASLWAFVAALGKIVDPVELFAAYGIANVLAVIPITPGGLGIIDTVAPLLLVSSGVTRNLATLAVIGWRLVNFWLPIPVGAAAYISLRVPRGSGIGAQRRALHEMAEEAKPTAEPSTEASGTLGPVFGPPAPDPPPTAGPASEQPQGVGLEPAGDATLPAPVPTGAPVAPSNKARSVVAWWGQLLELAQRTQTSSRRALERRRERRAATRTARGARSPRPPRTSTSTARRPERAPAPGEAGGKAAAGRPNDDTVRIEPVVPDAPGLDEAEPTRALELDALEARRRSPRRNLGPPRPRPEDEPGSR